MEIAIWGFVILLIFLLGTLAGRHIESSSPSDVPQPLPDFPAKGFGGDKVPVSGMYKDIVTKYRKVYKRGWEFENPLPYLHGKSFWVEIERLESEPRMNDSLVDEIENLLD